LYDFSTPSAILKVVDNSVLNLRGGTFFGAVENDGGAISQEDNSIINIYGHSFVVSGEIPIDNTPPMGVVVRGIYASAEPFSIRIGRRSSSAQVFLHVVPEPSALSIILSLGCIAGLRCWYLAGWRRYM
jgi:hypothetical protein